MDIREIVKTLIESPFYLEVPLVQRAALIKELIFEYRKVLISQVNELFTGMK